MERFKQLLVRNEEQINTRVSLLLVYELGIMCMIMLLNEFGIFQLYSYATSIVWKEIAAAALVIPFIAINVFHVKGAWVKYLNITCSVIASGVCYLIFNRQAELLFLFPTILVCLYYNITLTFYTLIVTIATILGAQILAGYYLLPMIYRTSYGLKYVLIDTAVPQVLFYICFALAVRFLNARTLELLEKIHKVTLENEILGLEKESAEMRGRLAEREKVSRAIHNSVGHTITAAVFALEAADVLRPTDPAAADEKTQRAIQRMRESMETIRNSVRVLDKNNVLTISDLERMIMLCCRQIELDADVFITIDTDGLTPELSELPVPSERISFIYGALQECITNGLKHGGAKHIKVTLNVFRDTFVVDIWNDGNTPSKKPVDGFGLSKIRTYTESHGGSMSIELNGGFTVTIELPLGGH